MGELLHTARVGDADETVVFLHGLFGQGKNFQTIARGLEPEHGSLLVDLPNHGESAWTERVDYAQMADAVAQTVRAQVGKARADGGTRAAGTEGADAGPPGGPITPVHVVGHSMGGKVAMLLALRHPELVARLVVVDISPAGANGTGEFEHLLGALATLDLEALTSRADADAGLSELIPNRTVRGFLLQNLRREGDGWRWRANLDLLRASLDVIAGFPGTRRASFDGPVLWVAGDRSDYVRPEHGPTMRALFPRVRQLTVKGSGHWVHSEQPDVFIQALRVFLGQG